MQQDLIIGRSPQIKKAKALAKKIARSGTPSTLITGESGTGKDLFAQLIHHLSTKGNQPFVDINCGAISETLLESELFGYEKGAFTGAYHSKPGLFELADGGTIFLDEIGSTSQHFQVRLLKAVEHKKFRRINSLKEIRIATRIIAATNMDLHNAIKEGQFRADLFYRLNVCQIHIPPLRERGDDIVLLADHFICQLNSEYHRAIRGLEPCAVKLLQEYQWPGNVRQLKNTIERAILVEADDWIKAEHLLLKAHGPKTPAQKLTDYQEVAVVDFDFFHIPTGGISIDKLERDVILSALQAAGGNLSKAARLLKMKRGRLRYRLKRLGLKKEDIIAFRQG
ncbi:MAG: sigma-54 interaction domain-containing protein [bacterium]